MMLGWKDLDLFKIFVLAFDMTNKEEGKQKRLKQLIESLKSEEDKLSAVRLISNEDDHRAASAIKSLMSKKWLQCISAY